MSDVKITERFASGGLTDLWRDVLMVAELFPSEEKAINELQYSLVHYTQTRPWPPDDLENYNPEEFKISLRVREFKNFYFYLGAAYSAASIITVARKMWNKMLPEFDLEAEIVRENVEYYKRQLAKSEKLLLGNDEAAENEVY